MSASAYKQEDLLPLQPHEHEFSTPTPFNCRRCNAASERPGFCKGCADDIIGRSSKNRDTRTRIMTEERIGKQVSFFVTAFIVWPVAFGAVLVATALMHPDYSIGKSVLWSLLISSGVATATSWAVLTAMLSKKDPLLALLALRSYRKIYQEAEYLKAIAPRLFTLHIIAFGATIIVGFLCLATSAFTPDDLRKSVGLESACVGGYCESY